MDVTHIQDNIIAIVVLVVIILVLAGVCICVAFFYKNWTFLNESKADKTKSSLFWIVAGFLIMFALLIMVGVAYYFANGLDFVDIITKLASEN